MDRSTEHEERQNRCINFITLNVIVFCAMIMILPPVAGWSLQSKCIICIPSMATRIAAVAASLPLLCDISYDFSLPQRLTYPRTMLLTALFVPNAIVLVVSLFHPHPHGLEVCLKYASELTLTCGILAYVAGEVVSKRLLICLAISVVWACGVRVLFLLYVFLYPSLPKIVIAPVVLLVSSLLLGIQVWFIRDMRALNHRRKMFAMTYCTAAIAQSILSISAHFILLDIGLENYVQDANIMIQIVITIAITIVSSRMAQHDATTAVVRRSTTPHYSFDNHCDIRICWNPRNIL